MALAAEQVLIAVAGRLTGTVVTSRPWPLTEADLPAWRVSLGEEQVELITLDEIQQHTLRIRAQAVAQAASGLDVVLNAQLAAGLATLFVAPVPYRLELLGIERPPPDGDDEATLGEATLVLQAMFETAPAAPETIL